MMTIGNTRVARQNIKIDAQLIIVSVLHGWLRKGDAICLPTPFCNPFILISPVSHPKSHSPSSVLPTLSFPSSRVFLTPSPLPFPLCLKPRRALAHWMSRGLMYVAEMWNEVRLKLLNENQCLLSSQQRVMFFSGFSRFCGYEVHGIRVNYYWIAGARVVGGGGGWWGAPLII